MSKVTLSAVLQAFNFVLLSDGGNAFWNAHGIFGCSTANGHQEIIAALSYWQFGIQLY